MDVQVQAALVDPEYRRPGSGEMSTGGTDNQRSATMLQQASWATSCAALASRIPHLRIDSVPDSTLLLQPSLQSSNSSRICPLPSRIPRSVLRRQHDGNDRLAAVAGSAHRF